MKKQFLFFLGTLIIILNTQAQLFDDGKVKIDVNKSILDKQGCGTHDWNYSKIEFVVTNYSGKPITILKIEAQVPPNYTSIETYVGGSFYPCNMPFGWTASGQHFIASFNINIPDGKTFTCAMYNWVWGDNWGDADLNKINYTWNFKYTINGSSSNNQQTNNNQPTNNNGNINSKTQSQSIKTKYYIENGQLVIDNGDTRDLYLISKMTPSEISYYENLSGLKLKPTNNTNTNNTSSNNQSAIIQQENSYSQQRNQQQEYEIFRQQQQERQQREFNDHIQRQIASDERFSNSVNLAGNFLLGILNAGRDKKMSFAANFAIGYTADINSTKKHIKYYKQKDSYSEYSRVDYELNESYLNNKSVKINNQYVEDTYEGSAIKDFISFISKDSKEGTNYENDMPAMLDWKTHILLTTRLYNGKIDIHPETYIQIKPYEYRYIRLLQTIRFSFYKPNGSLDAEVSVFGVKNVLEDSYISNPILFSIFDIISFENVAGRTESLPDGSSVYYPKSIDEVSNFKYKTTTFPDGSSTADRFNLLKVQLSTGEYFFITTRDDADEFIENANILLEKARKEYFYLQNTDGINYISDSNRPSAVNNNFDNSKNNSSNVKAEKDAPQKEDENLKIFKNYYDYYDKAGKAYYSKNFEESFKYFQLALAEHDLIYLNNLKIQNGISFSSLDTNVVYFLIIIGQELKKTDELIPYYKRIVDANLTEKEYLMAYEGIVEYYQRIKNEAAFKEYLSKGKTNYPNESYWEAIDIENSLDGLEKVELFKKYEELSIKYPNSYTLFFNYAYDLNKYVYSDQSTSNEPNDLKNKIPVLLKKAIAINSTADANILLANFYYNYSIDFSEAANKIPGNTPNDEKRKKDLNSSSWKALEDCIPYAETTIALYSKLGTLMAKEKTNLKLAYDMLIGIYEATGNSEKAVEYKRKKSAIE